MEDTDFFASGQRNMAPGRGDFHSAACKPARADGRICQHDDLQRRRVGNGDRHDRADFDSYLHGALSTKRAAATFIVDGRLTLRNHLSVC